MGGVVNLGTLRVLRPKLGNLSENPFLENFGTGGMVGTVGNPAKTSQTVGVKEFGVCQSMH